MMEAIIDSPPIVVAELVGIEPRTAERWAGPAGGRWIDFITADQI
ncbi:hypothetical protein [Streptomyces sp. LARHCF252]